MTAGKIIHRGLPDQTGVQLRTGFGYLLRLPLLLVRTGLLDGLAQAARVIAIEGLVDTLGKSGAPGVADDHPGPRHRLQQCPMQAQGKDQHQHSNESDQGSHGPEFYDKTQGRQSAPAPGVWSNERPSPGRGIATPGDGGVIMRYATREAVQFGRP